MSKEEEFVKEVRFLARTLASLFFSNHEEIVLDEPVSVYGLLVDLFAEFDIRQEVWRRLAVKYSGRELEEEASCLFDTIRMEVKSNE